MTRQYEKGTPKVGRPKIYRDEEKPVFFTISLNKSLHEFVKQLGNGRAASGVRNAVIYCKKKLDE